MPPRARESSQVPASQRNKERALSSINNIFLRQNDVFVANPAKTSTGRNFKRCAHPRCNNRLCKETSVGASAVFAIGAIKNTSMRCCVEKPEQDLAKRNGTEQNETKRDDTKVAKRTDLDGREQLQGRRQDEA